MIAALALAPLGCAQNSPSRSADVAPHAPVGDAAEPDADADACARRCVADRQMEARAVEAIEADCRRECRAAELPSP